MAGLQSYRGRAGLEPAVSPLCSPVQGGPRQGDGRLGTPMGDVSYPHERELQGVGDSDVTLVGFHETLEGGGSTLEQQFSPFAEH